MFGRAVLAWPSTLWVVAIDVLDATFHDQTNHADQCLFCAAFIALVPVSIPSILGPSLGVGAVNTHVP